MCEMRYETRPVLPCSRSVQPRNTPNMKLLVLMGIVMDYSILLASHDCVSVRCVARTIERDGRHSVYSVIVVTGLSRMQFSLLIIPLQSYNLYAIYIPLSGSISTPTRLGVSPHIEGTHTHTPFDDARLDDTGFLGRKFPALGCGSFCISHTVRSTSAQHE
jgi:hypothetical protein